MRRLFLKANATNGIVTDLQDNPIELPVVQYGTYLLFCVQFLETDGTTVSVLNLDGADGMVLTVKKDRLVSDTTELTSQSDYNQGEYAAYEDLTIGRATWLARFDTEAVKSALGSAEYVDVWCELGCCDQGRYEVLGQFELRIVPKLFDGTCTAPTPTPTPTPTTAP